ncbi:MFS transporter [Desertihabitans brevis]|nr:MFS transporter [Desertihabitans brevis]
MPDADHRRSALLVCLVAGAMTLLDVSIVNVALPSIRTGLGAGESTVQWVVAGYSLAFGILLVPAGRLGDARSRRAVFMTGVALFTVASALCGAAQGPGWLAAARVAQGLGGGMIAPQVSGFIQNLFSGAERGRAFGLFGATIGVSTAIGPMLGGVLVGLGGPDLGWRLVFYVNVPIGAVLLVLARRYLPAPEHGRRQSLDPVGVLLFAAAMFTVLLPLVQGEQSSLTSRPWWLLAVAAVLLALFALWERHWRRRGQETLVDPTLLRNSYFLSGLGLGTLYFAGFTAVFVVLTLYLQDGLGYSPLQAGLTQMPFAVGSAVSAWQAGRLVSRLGRTLVVTGLVLVVAGLLAVDLLAPVLDAGQAGWVFAPFLLLAGIGGGLVISPNVTLTLAEVDPVRAGVGGGLLQTAQRVGGAVGVAVVLAVFYAYAATHGDDLGEALSASLRATLGLVTAALVLGVVDLLRRRRSEPRPGGRAVAD